ncbi:MAG TPA: ATP synthase subunit I [Methylomirabilota bacterium]
MSDFVRRVLLASSLLAVPGSLLATGVWGPRVGFGVLIGAAVAAANFAWLARGLAQVATAFAGRRPRVRWILILSTRYLVSFVVLAAPVALGWAHPAALGVGLTALPVALTLEGWRAARGEAEP